MENARTGDVLTLITSHPRVCVEVWDVGRQGICMRATGWWGLEPNETKEFLAWLVLCGSVEQARSYRVLGEVCELP